MADAVDVQSAMAMLLIMWASCILYLEEAVEGCKRLANGWNIKLEEQVLLSMRVDDRMV